MRLPRVLKVRVGHDADGSGFDTSIYLVRFARIQSLISAAVLVTLVFLALLRARGRTILSGKVSVWIWVGLQVLFLIILGGLGLYLTGPYKGAQLFFYKGAWVPALLCVPGILVWMALGGSLLFALGHELTVAAGVKPSARDDGGAADDQPSAADSNIASAISPAVQLSASTPTDLQGGEAEPVPNPEPDDEKR